MNQTEFMGKYIKIKIKIIVAPLQETLAIINSSNTPKPFLENNLNLLTNNLNRRKDELVQALQEISVEDRKRQLENTQSELKDLAERIETTGKQNF